ncbi:MAG: hypothetical protein QXN60_00790 [Nitrososphaerota archaeon]
MKSVPIVVVLVLLVGLASFVGGYNYAGIRTTTVTEYVDRTYTMTFPVTHISTETVEVTFTRTMVERTTVSYTGYIYTTRTETVTSITTSFRVYEGLLIPGSPEGRLRELLGDFVGAVYGRGCVWIGVLKEETPDCTGPHEIRTLAAEVLFIPAVRVRFDLASVRVRVWTSNFTLIERGPVAIFLERGWDWPTEVTLASAFDDNRNGILEADEWTIHGPRIDIPAGWKMRLSIDIPWDYERTEEPIRMLRKVTVLIPFVVLDPSTSAVFEAQRINRTVTTTTTGQ